MSVKESPLAAVKRLYESKEKLVDSLAADLAKESDDESKGELKQRLLSVSNKKLLRLAEALQTVKSKYNDRDGLVRAVSGDTKDQDYVNKLHTYSLQRLLDMAQAAEKRAKRKSRAAVAS